MTQIPEIKITLSFDKKIKKSELKTLSSSNDTVKVLREIFNADTFDWKEEVILLCTNRRNAIVGYYKVSSGGVSGTVLDPKVIFTTALNCTASGIIIAHNHPSGNLTPSVEDDRITAKIKEAGKMLDINLIDSVILTDEGYYSYIDNGKL